MSLKRSGQYDMGTPIGYGFIDLKRDTMRECWVLKG
jgi:hypothetical protein